MTRPTPLFVASLIGLAIIILGLWLIASTYNYAMNARAEQLIHSKTWAPPVIDRSSGCTLWDCIRNGEYR